MRQVPRLLGCSHTLTGCRFDAVTAVFPRVPGSRVVVDMTRLEPAASPPTSMSSGGPMQLSMQSSMVSKLFSLPATRKTTNYNCPRSLVR